MCENKSPGRGNQAAAGENKQMTRQAAEQQIASDLNLIDMIEAFGAASAKRAARKQRKAIMAQIKAWNVEDGLADISADDLIRELMA